MNHRDQLLSRHKRWLAGVLVRGEDPERVKRALIEHRTRLERWRHSTPLRRKDLWAK